VELLAGREMTQSLPPSQGNNGAKWKRNICNGNHWWWRGWGVQTLGLMVRRPKWKQTGGNGGTELHAQFLGQLFALRLGGWRWWRAIWKLRQGRWLLQAGKGTGGGGSINTGLSTGTAGTTNTGGGGGGGGTDNPFTNAGSGGTGGSGIVIIKYTI
jgi:hypothetical protein